MQSVIMLTVLLSGRNFLKIMNPSIFKLVFVKLDKKVQSNRFMIYLNQLNQNSTGGDVTHEDLPNYKWANNGAYTYLGTNSAN